MGILKNVKAKEQNAVLRHIQHRTCVAGKTSNHVRVRGHKIDPEKLSRWMKEAGLDQPSISTRPLSRPLSRKLMFFYYLTTCSNCSSVAKLYKHIYQFTLQLSETGLVQFCRVSTTGYCTIDSKHCGK
jgi:hypothetical protein